MYQNLIYKKESSLAILQLNRPQKKNSLNMELRHEIEAALKEIAEDPKQKVVILTGGEDFFCAGADIGEIQDASTAEETYKHSREFQLLFDRIEALPQPVIAAVAGYALGGGCEMTLACDFRIAAEGTKFGVPEIKIGAFPGGGGTQRLPRLIGASKAKEMILTGDMIGADEALACGLVMKVVPKDKLLEESKSFAAKLAALPRLAMAASKMLINRGLEIDLASGLEMEARSFANLAGTNDLKEGTSAFLEKRKPNFTD
ncbi:MAG: enoyl-CoA hydratase/isomerase family protein [Deltaproteobacteria bacterium]|nr:enoyl-CoA hydratase/isomerase family protein [Deltaproteobacteria bacterium]